MQNEFHTDNLLKSVSNYPVSKGDTPGHAFHGNQYVSESNAAGESRKLADAVKSETVSHMNAEAQHRNIARACEEISKRAADNGLRRISNAFSKAAQAHRDASAAHIAINNPLAAGLREGQSFGPASAKIASDKAAKATEYADQLNAS